MVGGLGSGDRKKLPKKKRLSLETHLLKAHATEQRSRVDEFMGDDGRVDWGRALFRCANVYRYRRKWRMCTRGDERVVKRRWKVKRCGGKNERKNRAIFIVLGSGS